MPNQPVTRNELLALRASLQVMVEQTEKLLARMDDMERKPPSSLSEAEKARILGNRMKTIIRARDRANKKARL